MKLRPALSLLAVTALVAAGCGESETAPPAAKDSSGKATSTPAKKGSGPSGY